MNAKKIMGAVLVALLAAALFVGAGAAADDLKSGTVFINQKLGEEYKVVWTGATGTVEPTADATNTYVYFPAGTEGVYTYTNASDVKFTITVKAPAATISGIAGDGASAYPFIPGTLYKSDVSTATFYINSPLKNYTVYLAKPGAAPVAIGDVVDGNVGTVSADLVDNITALGEYSITLQYNLSDFVAGTKVNMIETAPVTFTLASADDASITASAEQVLTSEPVVLTITGQPGVNYSINWKAGAFKVDGKQISLNAISLKGELGGEKGYWFNMPNTGSIDITVKPVTPGKSATIKLVDMTPDVSEPNKGEVTIKFTAGSVYDVKTDAASYFIGAKATITGISTADKIQNITITGNNFKAEVGADIISKIEYGTGTQMSFKIELPTGTLKNQKEGNTYGKLIDVGPYVVTLNTSTGVKASVALLLTQPFLSIVSGPEVVVQEEEAEFIINAEATDNVTFYIFGNNYFLTGLADKASDNVNTHFSVLLNESQTDAMDEGQYFAVFQHPMYDEEFNVTASDNQKWIEVNGKDVIDLTKRQSANAAEALCVELDAQNIDDIYVKHSFFVVDDAESSYISDIPEEVAKGTTITVNGVDTANAGKPVTVQMLSTAFAAIPKEEQNLASFAVIVNTVIAEDGTWEVALDTSDLAIDEYNVKVFIDGDEKKKAVTNVVAAADKPVDPEQPGDEPEQPEEPVAPETPGFGALAALAGLGAVAVLLLRRE
ncbi:MAG: PGF-CTERM sorting domain-containing protein [Methanocorpusculum sp.]|nr:PGF-CTERM sorting domain-containing protein [Methanocorpusculum sp.]